MLDLIRLLDLDADADTVDARLDEDPLVLISGNRQRVQDDFRGGFCLDLGDNVPLGDL